VRVGILLKFSYQSLSFLGSRRTLAVGSLSHTLTVWCNVREVLSFLLVRF
jgi:hypothetical protein